MAAAITISDRFEKDETLVPLLEPLSNQSVQPITNVRGQTLLTPVRPPKPWLWSQARIKCQEPDLPDHK